MPRPKEVSWLTVGPEPHFATCQRCGRTVPKPPLPMKVDAFVAYCDAFAKEHETCPEPVASAVGGA